MTILAFRRWPAAPAAPAALLALAGLLPPTSAAAQEAEPELIPRAVAEALMANDLFLDDGGEVRILVGRLPDHLAGLVPAEPGAEVVGSVVRRRMTEAVLDLPGTPDGVLARWEEALLERGWERLQATMYASIGGFETSSPRRGHQFCMGDSLTLSLDARRRDGGSRLRLVLPRLHGPYNVCQHRDEMAGRGRPEDSPLPRLTAPSGVRMRGAGSGGADDAYDSRGLAETDMPVPGLAEHFHRQLEAAGWAEAGRAAGDDVVVYRYRVPDEGGEGPWLGLLTVSRGHAADQRYLTLEARRADRW